MIDSESRNAWLGFVHAERLYRDAIADLRRFDLDGMLREGLSCLEWRRQALDVISGSDWRVAERLLPELFQLSLVSHSLLGEVRRCILDIPQDALAPHIPPFVDSVVSDEDSDYEAYRRTAELLRMIGDAPQLDILVEAAMRSSDIDIREVGEDFLLN